MVEPRWPQNTVIPGLLVPKALAGGSGLPLAATQLAAGTSPPSPLAGGEAGGGALRMAPAAVAAYAKRANVPVTVMADLLQKTQDDTLTAPDMMAVMGVPPVYLPKDLGGISDLLDGGFRLQIGLFGAGQHPSAVASIFPRVLFALPPPKNLPPPLPGSHPAMRAGLEKIRLLEALRSSSAVTDSDDFVSLTLKIERLISLLHRCRRVAGWGGERVDHRGDGDVLFQFIPALIKALEQYAQYLDDLRDSDPDHPPSPPSMTWLVEQFYLAGTLSDPAAAPPGTIANLAQTFSDLFDAEDRRGIDLRRQAAGLQELLARSLK